MVRNCHREGTTSPKTQETSNNDSSTACFSCKSPRRSECWTFLAGPVFPVHFARRGQVNESNAWLAASCREDWSDTHNRFGCVFYSRRITDGLHHHLESTKRTGSPLARPRLPHRAGKNVMRLAAENPALTSNAAGCFHRDAKLFFLRRSCRLPLMTTNCRQDGSTSKKYSELPADPDRIHLSA